MYGTFAAQKRKFSIKDFFSKCDQIRSFMDWKLQTVISNKNNNLTLNLIDFEKK